MSFHYLSVYILSNMKKIIIYIMGIVWLTIFGFTTFGHAASENIVNDPRYKNFVWALNRADVVYKTDSLNIKSNISLKDNIYAIFYPTSNGPSGQWGILYKYITNIWIWLLVLFIILNGMYMVRFADTEKELEKAKMNFIYMWYGAFLVFGAVWLLGLVKIWWNADGIKWLISNVQNNLLFQILTFLKAAAFFVAIIMIVYYGVQIIRAYEKEDKLKEWKNWIVNVLAALVFIKVIDYMFYIATQNNFKSKIIELVVSVSKVMWRIIWAISIFYVIYAGFQLVTSNWDESKYKNAINTLKTIFLVGITIMLFLLITYQLFTDVFK